MPTIPCPEAPCSMPKTLPALPKGTSMTSILLGRPSPPHEPARTFELLARTRAALAAGPALELSHQQRRCVRATARTLAHAFKEPHRPQDVRLFALARARASHLTAEGSANRCVALGHQRSHPVSSGGHGPQRSAEVFRFAPPRTRRRPSTVISIPVAQVLTSPRTTRIAGW